MFRRGWLGSDVRGGVVVAAVLMGLLVPQMRGVAAQNATSPGMGPVREVTPGAAYAAGGLHRLLFGDHNRDLWTTPIRVPELDLSAFAGGLQPLRRGGGLQTKALRFRAADGRDYVFRSVDKDPSGVLPPELHETLVDRLIQDQTSAGHPTAPLVVAPLLEAVGVLHPVPQLVIMPDDPRLGEFRAEFAGLLGTIEERPDDPNEDTPGFAGASQVVGTDRLFELLENRGERVDERAFLTARLVDLFLGDWDRHRDQWRWARFGSAPDALWQPIPRDRDQAFVRLDGLLLHLARRSSPQLVSFGEQYANIVGLTWNGRELDRRFLVGLEWPVWDSIAGHLEARLTDDVIAEAVRRLPPEHYAVHGEALTRALLLRRDALREITGKFYRLLAGEVDIHTSDLADVVDVRREAGGAVEVTIRSAADDPDTPRYRRRFLPGETEEVRVYLYGGTDSVMVGGTGGDRIVVRVVGGGGADVFVDTSRGGAHFYDSRGENRFVRGSDTRVNHREFVSRLAAPRKPMRDWGATTFPIAWFGGSPDIGVLVGAGIERYTFGFRREPYASHVTARLAYATGAQGFRAELAGKFRRENSPIHLALLARASGIEVVRFHGFGNETELAGASSFYKVEQSQYLLEPELVVPFSEQLVFAVGPSLQWSDTRLRENTFIEEATPYGADRFGQAGARARLALDARNHPRGATRGVLLSAGGGFFPALWDVESAFGDVHAEASAYLTPPGGGPTLALRAGAKKVFGDYPFHEAAYIGDASTVRLGTKNRFAGDAEVHGTAEARMKVARVTLILPGDLGVLGFGDAGRVFLDGESSNRLHHAFGGGLWFAVLGPANTLSLSVARSEEKTGVYLQAGFAF